MEIINFSVLNFWLGPFVSIYVCRHIADLRIRPSNLANTNKSIHLNLLKYTKYPMPEIDKKIIKKK